MAELLEPAGNKTAMRIHLQRVVGSLVSSAHGAATFYSGRPRAHHQARQRKDREEDCDGALAFDAEFAAQAGLAAYAPLCRRHRRRSRLRRVEALRRPHRANEKRGLRGPRLSSQARASVSAAAA
jgi:hypothetical protein